MSVLDNQNGGQSQVCVKIIVPPKAPIKIYIPLEPSATGTPAECPDNATMAQIAAEYVAAIKTQPGVLDVVVNRVVCDWLVRRRGFGGLAAGGRGEGRPGCAAGGAPGCEPAARRHPLGLSQCPRPPRTHLTAHPFPPPPRTRPRC